MYPVHACAYLAKEGDGLIERTQAAQHLRHRQLVFLIGLFHPHRRRGAVAPLVRLRFRQLLLRLCWQCGRRLRSRWVCEV